MLRTSVNVPAGLKTAIAKLVKMSEDAKRLTVVAVSESALIVENEAKRTCPIATGTLRDSIKREFTDGGMSAVISAGGFGAPYAPILEYSHIPGEPIAVKPRVQAFYTDKQGRVRILSGIFRKGNTNPGAVWGFLRLALYKEMDFFIKRLRGIVEAFT